MESMGVYSAEEADFMAQLLSNFSAPNEQNIWPVHELTTMDMASGNNEGSNCSLEITNSNLYTFSQLGYTSSSCNSTNNASNILFPTSHKMLVTYNNCSTDFCMGLGDLQNTNSLDIRGNDNCLDQLGMGGGNRGEESGDNSDKPESAINPHQNFQYDMPKSERAFEEKVITPSIKRSRSSSENVQTDKTKMKSKKSKKVRSSSKNEEESLNGGQNGQSSSCCSSGDDYNSIDASQDLSGSSNARARRGSATDPQSLYARKRREKINERLRILQNLVPNGTKVDISTMLEEAVQYVKFLQLQIKLLSSDDMWMYAPIAYNGKNIGLDLNLTMSKEP